MKKKVTKKEEIVAEKYKETEFIPPAEVLPSKIAPLSVDYGREDLNNIAIKINEVIDHLNGSI